MSMFLDEGAGQQQTAGAPSFGAPAGPDSTVEDVALMQRVLSAASRNPNLIPEDFMAYVLDFIQTQRLQIPIGQVFGFQKFVSTQVTVALGTSGGLAFAPNTANSGAGPSLSGLVPGSYVIMAGFDTFGVNGPQLVVSPGGMTVTVQTRAALLALTGTTLTSTLSGTGGGAGGSISNPWLLALRYNN